ncbi:MAG: helix-turn-helix domain-containing protein [Desulfobulbaceae bacterium]|nr:helix-turn-helix domain-containing protein [Desulfobulbaceae bacterium]
MEHFNGTTSAPQAPIIPLVMNDVQAAEYLGISPHTLRKWRSTGSTGPAYVCVGRLKKYRLSDLVAYAQSQTVAR